MFVPAPLPLPRVAMLLVLLPPLPPAADAPARAGRAVTLGRLRSLQQELGPAIHVLTIDAATHPAVVRSFDGRGLPAFVLVRDGVELWRQPGLPEGPAIAIRLLRKLAA